MLCFNSIKESELVMAHPWKCLIRDNLLTLLSENGIFMLFFQHKKLTYSTTTCSMKKSSAGWGEGDYRNRKYRP